MRNVFLIGGAPSSGSTLLVNLLAEDDRLLCLPETGLFAHGRNMIDLAASPRAREDLGWHLPWLLTNYKVAAALGWDMDRYEEAGRSHKTAFDLLRTHVDPEGRRILIEKTPENIFAFREYLSISPKNRVIVTSRDLLSVVQSLTRRNFNLLEAFLSWFAHSYETARLLADFPDQVFHCRYAELTSAPKRMVSQMLAFLDIGRKSRSGQVSNEPTSASSPASSGDGGLQALLDVSSWRLTDTAWSYSPSDTPRANQPLNLLGLDYQVLKRALLFQLPSSTLVSPAAVDDALTLDLPLSLEEQVEGEPIAYKCGSLLTQTLAAHFAPHLRRI